MSRASRLEHCSLFDCNFVIDEDACWLSSRGFFRHKDHTGEHVLWPSATVSKGDDKSLNPSSTFVCLLGVVWAQKDHHCGEALSREFKQIVASRAITPWEEGFCGIDIKSEPPHKTENPLMLWVVTSGPTRIRVNEKGTSVFYLHWLI